MNEEKEKELLELLIDWGRAVMTDKNTIKINLETGEIKSCFLKALNQKTPEELGFLVAGLANAMGLLNKMNPTDNGMHRTAHQAAKVLNTWWIIGAATYLEEDASLDKKDLTPVDLLGLVIESAVRIPTVNKFEAEFEKKKIESLFKEYDSNILN